MLKSLFSWSPGSAKDNEGAALSETKRTELFIGRRGPALTQSAFYDPVHGPATFAEVIAFARRSSWPEVEGLARDGYQSWLAPFKHYTDERPGVPESALERLITCVAAINISSARVTVEELADLESVMKDVSLDDVQLVAQGDRWLTNFLTNVWEYVHGCATLTSLPWNVTLPVADLCNARCTFCTSWIEGKALVKLDQIRAFSEVIENALLIGLIGHGEPLAHPQFDKICDIIAQHMDPRAAIYTITNGVYLGKWMHLLEAVNLRSVSISLNAATAATHDEVMGLGPYAFDDVVGSIKTIIANNRPGRINQVYITMVVTQQNMHEVADFVRLGNDLGVEGIWFRSLLPQSSLVPGLNYHTLAPNLHPDFARHKAEALAAIAGSRVAVQAEPRMWGEDILVGKAKAEVERSPPPFVTRAEALRDKELRRRNDAVYGEERLVCRGRPKDRSAISTVSWSQGSVSVETPAAPWSYAFSVPISWPRDVENVGGRVRASVTEVSGKPGLGLLDKDLNTWIDRVFLDEDGDVELAFPAEHGNLELIVENGSTEGVRSKAVISRASVVVGSRNQSWTGVLELTGGAVHKPLDPLDDGTNPFHRVPRFACKAVYYNLYLNEMFFRIVPCCYMTTVPGFEEIRFDGSTPFADSWNSPALVDLRTKLRDGPLLGACLKCSEKW